jgi:hypothetical protein|tara:strand:- start:1653 stop:1880 length:228 start_codon:yes stop_codon:yes gene_type:complete
MPASKTSQFPSGESGRADNGQPDVLVVSPQGEVQFSLIPELAVACPTVAVHRHKYKPSNRREAWLRAVRKNSRLT